MCPYCGSSNVKAISSMHDSQVGWTTHYRCLDCKREFTVVYPIPKSNY